ELTMVRHREHTMVRHREHTMVRHQEHTMVRHQEHTMSLALHLKTNTATTSRCESTPSR
ncbi:MAG: hypothetical protein ACI82G_000715, partial [Bradymonadia bacterium]